MINYCKIDHIMSLWISILCMSLLLERAKFLTKLLNLFHSSVLTSIDGVQYPILFTCLKNSYLLMVSIWLTLKVNR